MRVLQNYWRQDKYHCISLPIYSANIFIAGLSSEYWGDGGKPNRLSYCPLKTYIPMAITDKQTKIEDTNYIEK